MHRFPLQEHGEKEMLESGIVNEYDAVEVPALEVDERTRVEGVKS